MIDQGMFEGQTVADIGKYRVKSNGNEVPLQLLNLKSIWVQLQVVSRIYSWLPK